MIYFVFYFHILFGVEIQTSTHVENSINSQPPKISAKEVPAVSAEETIKKTDKGHSDVPPSLDVSKSTPEMINTMPISDTSSSNKEGNVYCLLYVLSSSCQK